MTEQQFQQQLDSNRYNKLTKINITERPNVHITQELLSKIWYLCHRINEVEWSGVLFYKTEGSISDISNLKFTCTDFYLMDKGTGAYTEYESDDSVLSFKIKNKYLPPTYKAGKLHSHNSMKVFHSTTDLEDLYEYSEGEMYYLSLIVNNKGEFDCKIAWWGSRKIEHRGYFTYVDDSGEIKQVNVNNTPEVEEQCIFVASCNVIAEIPDEFKERTDFIIKESELKQIKRKESLNTINRYDSLSDFLKNTKDDDKQTSLKFNNFNNDFGYSYRYGNDFDINESNTYNAYNSPNSIININKKLVNFIKTWIYGSDRNLEPSLKECLTTLELTTKDLNDEQLEEIYDTLLSEFELVADEVFGPKFESYSLLAQKVKSELESYSSEFPEMITDLCELLYLIIDAEQVELNKI